MNKSKLIPQDGDLFAMIREITKVDVVVSEKPPEMNAGGFAI